MEIKIVLTEDEVRTAISFYLEKEKGIEMSSIGDIELTTHNQNTQDTGDSPFAICHRVSSIVKPYEEVF
jgi:hypothetical protein